MANNQRCSAETFVRAWMESVTTREVAERTGYSPNTVSIVAMRLRRAGVKLPHMRRGPAVKRTDVETVKALNAIIEEARSGDRKR